MRKLILMGLLALGSYCYGYGCCGAEDLDMDFQPEKETEFYAFVSMSMPKATLKEISEHLERIGGSFVLRGLPGGSFTDFIQEVSTLRRMDIKANIQINPDLFEDYSVTAVPTFVYLPPKKNEEIPEYKKIVGNVSVPWALREMGVEL